VLKVLRWCQAGGGYKLQTVTPVRDKVSVANESELYAKLPLAVASLKAELSTAGQLDLEYVAVGQRVADRPPAALGGDCPGATHYVRSITVGAYSLDASGKAAMSASAEAGDKGAGGDHKEQVRHVRGSGDMAGCEKNAKSGGCDAVLQLGLAPLPVGSGGAVAASGGGEATGGMARIPGGTFMMGSDGGNSTEKPVHPVAVAAFSMDVTEVTVAAYGACVTAGKCSEPGTGDDCNWGKNDRQDHPINCVDWNQATAYCAYAGKRLPTEEEWEYAARGTDGRTYPWGNEAPRNELCWKRWASKEGTCVVGSHPSGASPFGLQDMAGNVGEWTSSNYCSYPINKCIDTARVSRGGNWRFQSSGPSSTYPMGLPPPPGAYQLPAHAGGRILDGELFATSSRVEWAVLVRRTYGFDALRCPKCDARLRVLSTITDPSVVKKILSHLGLRTEPLPLARARDPTGQMDLGFDAA
jgi:formylglycine-generating enzyme required for sulfatase activity